jgi:hypothetical protein
MRTRHPAFRRYLMFVFLTTMRGELAAVRALHRQWRARRAPIPGYEDWPGWPALPAGWSPSSLARLIRRLKTI